MHSSATAIRCSALTLSTSGATRRWGPPGATSISRRSAARRPGRTRQRVTPRLRRINGGTGTTTTTPRPRLMRSGSRYPALKKPPSERATPSGNHDRGRSHPLDRWRQQRSPNLAVTGHQVSGDLIWPFFVMACLQDYTEWDSRRARMHNMGAVPQLVSHNNHSADECELTILMPCLDEAQTIADCIRKAQGFLAASGITGEVLIADNGSSDASCSIATRLGARVLHVERKGYGSALLGGIRAARG